MADEETKARLTDKQRVFIEEYLKCFNASEAARRAGYSEKTAYSIGQENLKKPEVRAEIDARIAERTMGADEVLMRLTQQARADASKFYKCEFGEKAYVDMKALIDAGMAHLIKSISRDAKTGKITKIEFYDSQHAMELIGKHHKLFTDKTELSGDLNITVTAEDLSDDELANIAKSK